MADKDVLYHELLEALQTHGCGVCRLARRASDSYLRALIYEGTTDVKWRAALRDAFGLCYRHGWHMAHQRGAVLGTAIIYRDIVNTLINGLEANAAPPFRLRLGRGQPDLSRALVASAECPACILERDAEQRTARILLNHVNDPAIGAAYEAAGGLCLPHFQLLLTHASQAAARTLAGWQMTAWRRLRDELDELIRKHDYRFRSEIVTDAEAHAWERAVAAVVGVAEPTEAQ